MLLSEDDTAGDIFECKIGNLPAGETALLTMGFIAELSVEPEEKMRFTLPTVLNPRYFPGKYIIGLFKTTYTHVP